MDQENPPPSKPPEKKPAAQNNTIWYLILFGLLVLVVFSFFRSTVDNEIEYSDLLRLVAESDKENPDAKGYIDVTYGADEKKYRVRYSDLKKVMIDDYEVTGTVTRRLLDPPKTKAASTDKQATTDTPAEAKDADGGQPKTTSPPADDDQESAKDKDDEAVQENFRFLTRRKPEEELLAKTLDEHNVPFDYASGPNTWWNYIPMLLLTGLFIFFFIMMMRRMGGAGSPMAFGRHRGRMYVQEDIGITFEDVAGIDEAVEEVKEVVEFLRTPEKYASLGGRIPKGVILVGPPGTGKTLLARAIAGEAGVPFFSLSGSDFVEMFVGVGAARVRDVFQQAESKAPCIIFIDELDALGKTRGGASVGGHDEREQTLNALLVEMDGFDSNAGVIVIAATNRPETLDPALMRPGRFDREVLVDRPDVAGRKEILDVHARNVKLGKVVDLGQLAAITSGFCGADLANLINEAALLAARNGKSSVDMAEFNEAVERITAGLEKKQRVIQEDEKRRVAYHEAGHALVGYTLPNTMPVHKVSIIPRGRAALGYTMHRPEQDRFLMTQSELEAQIQILLAGTITEEMIFEDISSGASNDLDRASEIARSMVMDYGMSRLGRVTYRRDSGSPFLNRGHDGSALHTHSEQTAREIDEEVKHIMDEAIEGVRHILKVRREALVAISERLLAQEVIDADELREIMEVHASSPMIVPGTEVERKRKTEPKSEQEEADSDVG